MQSKQGSIFEAAAELLEKIRSGEPLSEDIKGWKHAGRDITKMRRDSNAVARLVRLKKDGEESAAPDASTSYSSEAEAQATHDRMVKLNPNRTIHHNLYVDGKFRKKLD